MRSRANPARTLSILAAFTLNLVVGPLAPMTIQAASDGIEDYAQCQIGNPRPAGLDCAEKWTNGILNATHSQYAEDEVVPQRLLMDFAGPGAHSVTISYMTRKDSSGQHHAYDYLATWDETYVNADRCQTPTATDCIGGAASMFPIPSDASSVSPGGPQPTSAHELPQASRQFVMYGGTISGTSAITHSVDPSEAGSDYGNITVSFSVGAGGKAQLLFGGHLASGLGPRGWGENLGSATISGGPYHIRITAIDGESIGQRDNQIMSGAITALLPSLNILKRQVDADGNPTTAPIDAGDTAYFEVIVWNAGPGTALNATLHDELPSDVDWSLELLNADADDHCGLASSALPGQPVEWSADCAFGELPPSSMADGKHLIFAGDTDPADCGVLDNLAAAAADGVDPVQASASITVNCSAGAALVIDKAASTELVHFVFDADGNVKSVDPAQVSWTLTYTLANGPVSGAVITDPLPDFLTFVSASDGGTFANGVITWSLGDLSQSGSVSFVTTVDPDAPETGPIVNVATIDSNETLPDDGEDSITVTSESELAGNPTPTPSVPNTALALGTRGEPVSAPIELMVVLFLGSLGTLALANVRAVRRRR